jgi:hypothetical protein
MLVRRAINKVTAKLQTTIVMLDYLLMLVSSSWPVPMSPEKADLMSPTPFAYHADTLIDWSEGLDAPLDDSIRRFDLILESTSMQS